MIDPWYIENLVCPVSKGRLRLDGEKLLSAEGRSYPIVDGTPVMLLGEARQTMGLVKASWDRANGDASVIDQRAPDLYLESVGISEKEKDYLAANRGKFQIDPVVSMLLGATSGHSYAGQIGNLALQDYPIPDIAIPPAKSVSTLLDVGCNWGRWSVSAARKGYQVVGIDPSLGGVLAARRVAKSLGQNVRFVVGDGRFLPFRSELFDFVYSYSVLQHFSVDDAKQTIREADRCMKSRATIKIQLANALGVRSFQHQARRRFRTPVNFEVRYWTPGQMKREFQDIFGNAKITSDCYFGLGWQKADRHLLKPAHRVILSTSEALKSVSRVLPPVTRVADSIFVESHKNGPA